MRKTVLGEKQQFFLWIEEACRGGVSRDWRGISMQHSVFVCVCARAHTCQVVFVSTIRLKAVLNQGLIFKVLQMSVKPRMDVFVPVGILFS